MCPCLPCSEGGADAVLGKLVNTGAKGGSSKATPWSVVCEGIEGKPSTYQLKKSQSFAKGPMRQREPRMHIVSEGVRRAPRLPPPPAARPLSLERRRSHLTCRMRLRAQPKEAARLKPKIEGLVSQQYELAPPPDDRQYRKLQGARVAQISADRAGRAQVSAKLPTVITEDMNMKADNEREAREARKREKETGEWTCASCKSVNHSRHEKCQQCNARKTTGDKMVRRDRVEVQNELFKLLEDNSAVCSGTHTEEDGPEACKHCRTHWHTKDLIAETKQPEAFLKSILKEMCTYIRKGDHQSTWVLKRD